MTGRPDTARALVFTGQRSLEFRQIEVPGPAADGALLAARSFRIEQAPPPQPGQMPQLPPGFPMPPTPPTPPEKPA